MNRKCRSVPAQFAPEAGFGVRVDPPTPFRTKQEAELAQLKDQLLQKRLQERPQPEGGLLLEWAANEAAALAGVTQYPLLVFPSLFEEKTEAALLRAQRQDRILQRSLELLAA